MTTNAKAPTENRRTLLTGSDGFVGTILQRQRPCIPLMEDGRPIDLRDTDALRPAVAAIALDEVIHLAAQSFVPASFANPRETYEINFLGTFNLLEALRAAGFKGRFLFVGSGDTYGLVPPDALPLTEEQPLKPRNPYAVSKVAAEALCYQWSQTADFEVVMTRSFNHIGPGQSERFVVSNFAKQVTEIRMGRHDAVLDVGDIDVTRDFTDVRDVVRAYLLLLEKGRSGEVYNVCSGVERPVRGLLTRLLELAGVRVRIEPDEKRIRRSEQRRVFGSNLKLQADTGWLPQITMDQSLADILDDWEKKLK
jgi:GDP-4-dehydro-6-deoxy-D-mannose reductase